MNINWESILSKYKSYIKSDECQKRIENAVSSGSTSSSPPDYMIDAANKLISSIQDEFYKAYPLGGYGSFYGVSGAESVKKIIDENLTITMMPIKDGKSKSGGVQYRLEIGFADESLLRRESLLKSKVGSERTGDGIDNIISLMDTGGGNKEVSGYWETRSDIYRFDNAPPYIKTPVPVFPKTGFILAAVESFNATYGVTYNCIASITAPDSRFYVRA